MPSLQEAIVRYGKPREQYLDGIPDPPRALIEQFVTECSGTLRFLLKPQNAGLVEDALLKNTRVFQKISARDADQAILRELFRKARETITRCFEAMPDALQQGRNGWEGIQAWALLLRNDMHQLLNVISPAKKVTMVVDRELMNTNSVIDYANEHPDALQLSGVITPFHEIDDRIVGMLHRIDDLREYGEVEAEENPETGVTDFYANGPCTEKLLVMHAPYDAKRIKTDPDERKRYCMDVLLPRILATEPDVVFLSNFKLILDPCVPQTLGALGIKIVNVHPSVLPLNKGWRTEKMALEGTNAKANGCTFHYVTPDLDGGATLLALPYPTIAYDRELARGGNGAEYATEREHLQRLLIMRAQSHYTPKILDWVAANPPQRIVSGDDAFHCELRSRPEGFDGHYERVLFQVGEKWLTLEEVLGKPSWEAHENIAIPRCYTFFLKRTADTAKHLSNLHDAARSTDAKVQFVGCRNVNFGEGFNARIFTSSTTFASALQGLPVHQLEVEELPVLATAKRKEMPK